MSDDSTVTFCDTTFGDTFIGEHRWSENWTDASAADKAQALVNATNLIQQFVNFYDSDGVEVTYAPEDETDELIPDWLRKACCYEALYLLDLDNDPARPFPLGILGIIQSGSDKMSHDYEPPLFSMMCSRLLKINGAIVHDPFSGAAWDVRTVL